MQSTELQSFLSDIIKLNQTFPWKIGNVKVLSVVIYLIMFAYGSFMIYKLEKKVTK